MSKPNPVPWWAVLPVIGILFTVVLLLFWKKRSKERFLIFTPPIRVTTERKAPVPAADELKDDLVVIKGIGPKSAAVLAAAGIQSFVQLANTPVERLRELMLESGLRLVDPANWAEQAAYLAEHG